MTSTREALLLNATASMALTSFAKQICEDAEYNVNIAIQGVEIFITGLTKGLEEHCNALKLDTNNEEIPDFIKGFFQEPANEINKEVDESLKHVCSFIKDKLMINVQTMCAIHQMANGQKNKKNDNDFNNIDFSKIKEVFDSFEKDKNISKNHVKDNKESNFYEKSEPKNSGQYDKLFIHHPPSADRIKKHEGLREFAIQYARYIEENTPPSSERTLAIRKLQETLMWANAALAINNED